MTPGAGTPPSGRTDAPGIPVSIRQRIQNPYINGYTGTMAWLPKRRVAVPLVATRGPRASVTDDRNFTTDMFKTIASYLTPDRIPVG